MKISIIIPAYNSKETIGQCLDASLKLDYPHDDYEILVVNDGSTDGTREIVEKYPVRLINLEKNSGRIIARETGARQATYDNLLFIDSRVIVSSDILKKIEEINYQPLLAGEHGEDKTSPFDTLFFLIRKKVYRPYYPQRDYGEELWIDLNNFDKAPKGTTCLFCTRELFLKSIPHSKGKAVNDDTPLLRNIVNEKRLLRHTALKINYLQRNDFKSVLRHIYERGPRFAHYYLNGPSRYYNLWLASVVSFFFILILSIIYPLTLFWAVVFILISTFILGFYLSENLVDFIIVVTHFPPVCLAFLAGIIKGKYFSRV